MKRRTFIAGLGGAVAWPLAARAQRGERVRRIGVLMGWSESDPQYQSWFAAFVLGLAQWGWANGSNVQIDQRWTQGEVDRIQRFAKELVELQPDVILSGGTPVTAAVQRETRAIPIVFAVVSDPVGAGFVASLARPGGNITGFINTEAAMQGKRLQMLTEIAPHLRRVAIMFNPDTAPGGGSYYLGSFEAAARNLTVEPVTAHVHSDAEIESAISFLGQAQGGLAVMTDSYTSVHRGTIISAAARNNVPAIFDGSNTVKEGALLSYGPNYTDMFRRVAGHVDRILRGTKPSDLPVQAPTKFELVINLTTAKALGLEIPPSLLALADELID